MTTYLQQNPVKNLELYEQDYCLWIETTANLLRKGCLEQIDFEHLIEEIDDIGKDKCRELKNSLIILLMHLLKHQYQPEKCSSSWRRTIIEQRRQIESLIEDSPSLKPYYLGIFDNCYSKAINDASGETLLPVNTFPAESPFLPEDVININFILSLIHQSAI